MTLNSSIATAAENVSMTVAGLLVPGPLMGGPARMMSPNADWAPVLPIRQSAATLWYHANTPNRTAQQVYNGFGRNVAGRRRHQ